MLPSNLVRRWRVPRTARSPVRSDGPNFSHLQHRHPQQRSSRAGKLRGSTRSLRSSARFAAIAAAAFCRSSMEGGALKSGCEQTVPQCALDIALQLIDWSSRRETRTLDGLVIRNRHREAKRSASFSDAVQLCPAQTIADRRSPGIWGISRCRQRQLRRIARYGRDGDRKKDGCQAIGPAKFGHQCSSGLLMTDKPQIFPGTFSRGNGLPTCSSSSPPGRMAKSARDAMAEDDVPTSVAATNVIGVA